MTTVAFQGEMGAFSEEAVQRFFGDVPLAPCRTFADVFEAVLKEKVNFGMVPVENSQAGSINETYDLLLKYDLNIWGEIELEVNHCLVSLPGETLGSIKRIYTHPQGLAQCDEFLRKLDAEIVLTYDTAGSAKLIRDKGLKNSAAIASERASRFYQMEILAHNIQTNPNNYTRFLVISREEAARSARSKTSLVFETRNTPGALYASLGVFATRNINLTKLESRPNKDKPWESVFYLDFEGHREDELCKRILGELEEKTIFLKVLGSFPRSEE